MITPDSSFVLNEGKLIVDTTELILQKKIINSSPISALFENPFSVYLLDLEGTTLLINEFGADVCGFDSPNHSLGKSLRDVSKEKTAQTLLANCQTVLAQNQLQFFDETNERKDNVCLDYLSIKLPWFDAERTLSGSLGFSIVLGKNNLSASLSRLTTLGLLSPPTNYGTTSMVPPPAPTTPLSQREKECLDFTLKNFTAKEIAKELGLSHRTIEEYLNNLKRKFKVASKHELIKKLATLPV